MWAVSLQTTGIETLGSTYARSFLIACPLILQPPNDSAGHSMLAKRDCFTRMFSCVRNCTLILMAIQYECQRTVWHCTNLRFKFLIQRSLIAQRHDNPLQLDSSRRCWHCSHVLLGWSRLMFGCTLPKPFTSYNRLQPAFWTQASQRYRDPWYDHWPLPFPWPWPRRIRPWPVAPSNRCNRSADDWRPPPWRHALQSCLNTFHVGNRCTYFIIFFHDLSIFYVFV